MRNSANDGGDRQGAPDASNRFELNWQFFLSRVVEQLVQGQSLAHVSAWAAAHGFSLLTLKAEQHPFAQLPQAERSRLACLLVWQVARVLPLPQQHFKPMALALPGRNEPCLCGSQKKFKHCCDPLISRMPGVAIESLAPYLFEALPRQAWKTLPQQRVPVQWVLVAVGRWLGLDDGDADQPALQSADNARLKDAQALLEPWADLPAPWPDKHSVLYDLLGDVYLELDRPRKRKTLAERMVERGETQVQALGWQRLALMASDAGRIDEAQTAMHHALQLAPNDPRTAAFEVTLLSGLGQEDRARQRADFHARRFQKMPPTPELNEAIAQLQLIAQHGVSQYLLDSMDDDSVYGQLSHWLDALPPPALALDLSGASAHDLGALTPNGAARAALQRWAKVFDLELPQLNTLHAPASEEMDFAHEWLPLLQELPLLGQCFEVLDALVLLMQQQTHPAAHALAKRMIERAVTIWDVLRAHYPQAACVWAVLDNRPALRLLAQFIELDDTPTAQRALDVMAHLVRVLNPTDNQGYRTRLAAALLRRDQISEALALCERYPDDRPDMGLLHSLALHRAGRTPEARAQLQSSLAQNSHLKRLLKASAAPKDPDTAWIKLGSLDEAKAIAHAQFDLWQTDDAKALLVGAEKP